MKGWSFREERESRTEESKRGQSVRAERVCVCVCVWIVSTAESSMRACNALEIKSRFPPTAP